MEHVQHTIALPLRLAAEPYAKETISASCVSLGLPSNSSNGSAISASNNSVAVELAALCDDDGIHAFCSSRLLARDELLERIQSVVPSAELLTEWKNGGLLVLIRHRLQSPGADEHNDPNQMRWYWYNPGSLQAMPIPPNRLKEYVQHKNVPRHTSVCAQLVTTAIRSYYSQQILEPSVRGFLSVLEKQFARADLYLFELLQNAVDDGASIVEFKLLLNNAAANQNSSSSASLRVRHNGRNFTPLDVLGLSSVGLSTKSRQGKRTIGFMGVGFKAVYKRYARVCIDDGTYRFLYQEPSPSTNNHQLSGYGWVMLPMWQEASQTLVLDSDKKDWCHFALEQPRGGAVNIQRDLLVLPRTAPPLLGRAALFKMVHGNDDDDDDNANVQQRHRNQWVLDWNGKRHTIERKNVSCYSSSQMDGSEVISVTIANSKSNNVKNHEWLFVTHRFKPSRVALETYRNHTKRSHEGFEEVCGFVPLLLNDKTQVQDVPDTLARRTDDTSPPSGWIHSVLPTKIRMPVPIHFQGSWLLSVDRQEVQNLTDNAWNGEILQQFPHLLATMFRWAAAQKFQTKEHYQAICQLLPTTVYKEKIVDNSIKQSPSYWRSVDILGEEVSLCVLEEAFWTEAILPVGKDAKTSDVKVADAPDAMEVEEAESSIKSALPVMSTSYYEGSNSIWVPPSWFDFLDSTFIRGWLGKRPLRTDHMGEAAYHFIFASNRVLGQLNPLPSRTRQLAAELGIRSGMQLQQESVWKTLRLMAAIGSAYSEYPSVRQTVIKGSGGSFKKQKNSNTKDGNAKVNPGNEKDDSDVQKPTLPVYGDWPIFITESRGLAKLDQVVLPSADFAELPSNLLSLLRPYCFKVDTQSANSQSQQQRSVAKKAGRFKHPSGPSPMNRLHHLLESSMSAVDRYAVHSSPIPKEYESNPREWDKIAMAAVLFLTRAREEMPTQVIGICTAASNFFETLCAQRELSGDDISAVLQLAKYAFETCDHSLLAYVMVDVSNDSFPTSSTNLVKAADAYIGKSLDEPSGPGSDLEKFAGNHLQYVSSRYNTILDNIARKKAVALLALAGVRVGMAVSVSVTANVEKDKRLLEKTLPNLPDKKLPALRKNATKSDVLLPYGLGRVMNRKTYYQLDASLPSDWGKLATKMSTTSAIGFISLLLAIPMDDATNVTVKSVPAAASCLSGKTEISSGRTMPLDTTVLSRNTAAPLRLRLYFLPPGQPGAKVLDLKHARLVEQLQSMMWLPCSFPSQPQVPSRLLRPREVLLEADSSRPEMPVVDLAPPLLKRLKASPICRALTWGTQSPPPPIRELSELVKEANHLLSLDPDKVDKEDVSSLASRMRDVWTTVCRSHAREGLSESDTRTLRSLLRLPCIPVRHVFDGQGCINWIVRPNRCVMMPLDQVNVVGYHSEAFKNCTVASLVASDFMCDFSHSKHNSFFHQPEVSVSIVKLAGIRPLAEVQVSTLKNVCGEFVQFCCAAEPNMSSSSLRDSFSLCMKFCLESPGELRKRGQAIKLYVRRGPGSGSRTLPARWVPMKDGPVQAVLGDNKIRLALLSPEMNIQLLGVLDHTENENNANSKMLAEIDSSIIATLGILRLSDKRFVVKTRARGPPQLVSGAPAKLQLVCAIMRSLELDRLGQIDLTSTQKNTFLEESYEPPLVIRHEALTREFQAPGMESPTSLPLYALFGRSPKLTKKRCILVSGAPDDYAMELEELILDHVGVHSAVSLAQMKPYRAAVRLLSHLENEKSFRKFIQRDFASLDSMKEWKTLIEKREFTEKLETAIVAKDRGALREMLRRRSELFDDKEINSVGTSFQRAREVLTALVKEEESRLEKGRLKEAQHELKLKTTLDLSLDQPASDNTVADTPAGGRGIGSGVDNRPAWVTGTKEGELLSKSPAELDTAELAPAGRGRGVSNLPAWMVTSEGPTKTSDTVPSSPKSNTWSPQKEASLDDKQQQEGKSGPEVQSVVPPPAPPAEALVSERESGTHNVKSLPSWMKNNQPSNENGGSTGRGRGVSNLPAWLVNKESTDGPANASAVDLDADDNVKRSRDTSDEDTVRQSKKFRLSMKKIEVMLDVQLPPSQAANFVAWLQLNVEKEVANRFGSVTIGIDSGNDQYADAD